ncbi:MAG: HDOD domain-containing protein [Candidatus Kapaibacteriota bacterium]|jgi:putative nucleotidyltransferase with HDIG domain
MNLIEYIKNNQQIATLPTVATKILKMIRSDNFNINEIANVVESDPGLTLKLIKVANSPLYGLRSQVNSVNHAIMTLGLNKLTNIVLSISLYSKFLANKQGDFAYFMDLYWQHSAATGAVSKHLCHLLKQNYKEMEFLGGLLHDIGKLTMLQYDTKKYTEVIQMVEQNLIRDVEAERQIFGMTHLEVGRELAIQWQLPKELIEIIALHNSPYTSKENHLLIAIIRFSDILCEMWGEGFYEGIQYIKIEDDESWKVIRRFAKGLDLDLEHITFELEQEFQKSNEFIKLVSR